MPTNNVALPAYTVARHAAVNYTPCSMAAAAVNRYHLPARPTAANLLQWHAAVDRWDRHADSILIGSAIFAALTVRHAVCSACSNRPRLCNVANNTVAYTISTNCIGSGVISPGVPEQPSSRMAQLVIICFLTSDEYYE